jgi:hypothetical protein
VASLVHISGFYAEVLAANAGNGLVQSLNGGAATMMATDNTVTYEGAPTLKSTGVGTSGYVILTQDWTATSTIVAGFAFRSDATPSGTASNFTIVGAPTSVFMIFRRGVDGNMSITWVGGTAGTAANNLAMSDDTWYWIDIRYVIDGSGVATVNWSVDGAAQTTTTRSGLTASGTTNQIRVGEQNAVTHTSWVSPIVLSATSADYPLGAHKVAELAPNADGAHSVGTATFKRVINNGTDAGGTTMTNSTTDGWSVLDDVPVTADGGGTDDWVSKTAGTGTDYVEFQHTDPEANSVPAGVRVVAALRNDAGTTANNAQIHLVEGTTEHGTAAFNGSIGSATTVYRTLTYSTKPTTGGWTRSALVDTRTRFRSTNLGAIPRLKAVWLEAAYPVVVTPPQIARPASTTTAGGWTASAGTLHSASSDQSDSTYITGTAA